MSLNDDINALVKTLGDVAEDLKQEQVARDMAHEVVEQVQSLTVGMWDRKSSPTMDHLYKIATQDDDAVFYGKIIEHVLHHTHESIDGARRNWLVRLNKWRPSVRQKMYDTDKSLEIAALFLTMRKVKLDILRKQEEEERNSQRSKV